MDVDPAASLRCWAIEIELGGRTFEVPALPAADWFPVLLSADLAGVLDLMVSSSDGWLEDMILSGGITADDLTEALTDAVEQAAGRSFWASCLLAMVAESRWAEINGELARRGFRWDRQPLGAALDALYVTMCAGFTEQAALDKFRALLEPPAHLAGREDQEQAMAQFEAIAGPKPPAAPVATSKGGKMPRSGVSRQSARSNAEPSGSEPPKTPRPPRPRRQAAP